MIKMTLSVIQLAFHRYAAVIILQRILLIISWKIVTQTHICLLKQGIQSTAAESKQMHIFTADMQDLQSLLT